MDGVAMTTHPYPQLATVVAVDPRVFVRKSGSDVPLRYTDALDRVMVGDRLLVVEAENSGFYALTHAERMLDRGSATLPDSIETVAVAHDLGVVPAYVGVQPKSEAALFVPAADATSFTVQRGGLSTGAIEFYWTAHR